MFTSEGFMIDVVLPHTENSAKLHKKLEKFLPKGSKIDMRPTDKSLNPIKEECEATEAEYTQFG